MNRRTFLQAGVGAGAAAALLARTSPLAMTAPRIRLITRGDDLGCARSLNRAMLECFEKGILKNCSVLAPSPYVAEGARLLARKKGLCFGLHCALTSEWDNVRWGPVAPKEKVPSLLDKNGHLHQTNQAVWQNARADEALIELQAQLDRARKLGFDIRYADLHMGTVARVPGLPEQFGDWCKSNRLIDTRSLGRRLPLKQPAQPSPDDRIQGDYVAQLIEALQAAEPGDYLIVAHPGYADAETRNLGHPGYPGDAVAHNLNWQRLGYVDPRILKYCRENGVEPIRYDEAKGL
jgi:chitin disaccharide deacetylase